MSVLGLIMSFFPISEVCDGTVSLTTKPWGIIADSQVYQAEDRQDKNKETSYLPHPGPRPEEAQGDTEKTEWSKPIKLFAIWEA